MFYIGSIIGVILLFILIIIRMTVYKQKTIFTPVIFYPPKDISVLEASYLIRGTKERMDYVSLLYEWANKGYIMIQKENNVLLFTKVKDISEDSPSFENLIFHKIFTDNINLLNDEDMKAKFFINIDKFSEVFDEYMNEKYFIKENLEKDMKLKLFLAIICCVPAITSSLISGYYYAGFDGATTNLALMVFILLIPFLFFLLLGFGNPMTLLKNKKIQYLITWYFILIFSFGYMLFKTINFYSRNTIIPLILSSLGMIFVATFHRYDSLYLENKAKLLKFKEFIMECEYDKIKTLIESDPNYASYILPYAIAFHIFPLWKDKFSPLLSGNPIWLETADVGSITNLISQDIVLLSQLINVFILK